MISNVQAVQVSRSTVELSWIDDTDPSQFVVSRSIDGAPFETLLELSDGTSRTAVDSGVATVGIGQTVQYSILNVDDASAAASELVTINDPEIPFTWSPPDPAASAPRYTSLETVKRRLRIDAANTQFDDDLTEAIVACEIALDYELGQSFPSTGSNPQYGTVPYSIQSLSTAAAIAVYKAADTPFGVAGSDDYFGALSVADVAEQTIRRSPLLRGLQRSFGIA